MYVEQNTSLKYYKNISEKFLLNLYYLAIYRYNRYLLNSKNCKNRKILYV